MEIIQNYIGGQFVPPLNGQYLDNFNPATGEVYGRIPDSGPDDVEAAVQAAAAAYPAWAALPPEQRHDILH
ncbi:MAG: aldehyde dehydrogenase family protein, partial [Saprospiraceae bacterium]|nr:aldehyde dehydrogenase family protein [Saprospiraceae bacterium]